MENLNNKNYVKNTDNIPQELKEINTWVAWKAEYKNNRFNKIPMNPKTGEMAKVNDKNTWGTFEQAVEACSKYKFSGVGLVLTEDCQIVGIDIDKCIDEEGNLDERAIDIIRTVQGYTEKSPSKRGIRIFCKGNIPDGRTRIDKLEMYKSGRYLTITGDVLVDYCHPILDRTDAVNKVYKKYMLGNNPKDEVTQQSLLDIKTDLELVSRIMKGKNSLKFSLLYSGDIAAYNNNKSAADMAMCNKLAYYTDKDPVLMDKIFRNSGLYRSKWDEVHFANGETYGQHTINKAINECKYTFNKFKNSNSKEQLYKHDNKSAINTKKQELKAWYIKNEKTGTVSINPGLLASHLIKNEKLICIGSNSYQYKEGIYVKCENNDVIHIIKNYIDAQYQSRRIIEDVKYLWTSDKSIAKSHSDINKDIYTIVVNNGLYNLQEKSIHEHSHNYLSTIKFNVEFDPFAECSNFIKYINQVVDSEMVDLIQEILGYFLIPTNKAQKSFMLTGPTNTGKSTFLNIVKLLLGEENFVSIPLQSMGEKFYSAELFGKLANIAGDLSDKAMKDSSFFKMATGEDAIMGEKKYGNPFSFQNTARFLFACNKLPETLDRTDAFYQRFILLPFYNQVQNINPFLLEKLEDEKDGIFFWALQGLERLVNNNFKFSEPQIVSEMIEEYKTETSNVTYFVKEVCSLESKASISSKELYDAYKEFCSNQGLRSMSSQKFTFELLNTFKQVSKKQIGIERKRCFLGIKANLD